MTPEEIAALRRMSSTGGLVSLTAKELSTILLERDRHAAEAKALREAAEALVGAVEQSAERPEWRLSLCSVCGALATERDSEESACDQHLDILDNGEKAATDCAAPLRALRALLGRTP